MTQITLVNKGSSFDGYPAYLHDASLKDGIAVDNDAYDAGTFIDRDFDVRGLSVFEIVLDNTHATNGMTYTIQKAVKDYDSMDDDLVDGDFASDASHTDQNVAALGQSSKFSILVSLEPTTTAVRLRLKRQTSGQNATCVGHVRGNQ